MGLDIYVGSLTRYFARDWKTVIQQASESQGIPVEVVRVNESEGAVTDPEELRPAVLAWRQGLSQGLSAHGVQPLEWDESGRAPYFTDKPAWDCYGALILWAAYSEHPELSRPSANPLHLPGRKTGDWHNDEAYRRIGADGFRTRYGQLLRDVEVWLPGEFDFTFDAQWLTGKPVRIGASRHLFRQLADLNASTWNAAESELERWRRDGAEVLAPLEVSARFAFSVLNHLAGKAVEHRLPMLLDY